MTSLKCDKCKSDLLPDARFCRVCGAAITSELPLDALEQPTAVLGDRPVSPTTRELHPRATSPTITGSSRSKRPSKLLIFALLFVFIMGFASVVKLIKTSSSPASPDVSSLMYPGALTIMNMANQDGSRTLQMETSDSLQTVHEWYQSNFTFGKTVRLTSNSAVIKSPKVYITLAGENNKTQILVKAEP